MLLDNSEIETVIIKISEFPESSRKWDDITDKPAVIAAGDTIQEALEQIGLENVNAEILALQEEQITQNEAIATKATTEYVDDEIGNVVEYVNQGDQANANAITAENQRATTAEQNISNNLATETTNRVAGDLTNANAIVAETNRAIAAEALKADKVNLPPTPSNVLDVNAILRRDNVISNIIDQYTGEPITATKVTGTPTVDNIIYFQIGSEYFKRNNQNYNAKWFGALGNGTNDDTIALNKWLNSGINLYLPDGIFLCSNQLIIYNDNVKITGTGTLKRANQIVANTTTAITTASNPTAITVDSTVGFYVGMGVTVTTGFNNTLGCYAVHFITSIVGNVITVNNNFTRNFPIGGKLVSHHGILQTYLTRTNIEIRGITLDGNKNNNNNYVAWQTNHSMYISSKNGRVYNCKIKNSQADGIIFGGTNFIFEDNTIEDSIGNAIHLSGIAGAVIKNNTLLRANLGNTGTDAETGSAHSEGLITWSELVSDIIVDGNYFDTGRTIIGGIGGSTNNDTQFVNNVCKNSTYKGIEVTQSSLVAEDGKNFIISNNKFIGCGELLFINTASSSLPEIYGIKNIIFSGNHLINSTVYTSRVKYMSIVDNIFEYTNITSIAINAINLQFSQINNNIFKNGNYGVYVASNTNTGTFLIGDNTSINNNTFVNQNTSSIFFPSTNGSQYRDFSVLANNIYNDKTNASFVAIQGMSGIVFENNNIIVLTNGSGIYAYGDIIATPASIQGSIVVNNTIRVPGGDHSVRIFGGYSKIVIKGNYLSKAVSNGSVLYNYVSDNYVIGNTSNLITDNGSRLLINTLTDNGVDLAQFNGSVLSTQFKISALNTAPASATATGTLGEIRVTATYIYVCTATNTWVRSALATW